MRLIRRIVKGATCLAVAACCVGVSNKASAQTTPVLVLLDPTAFDYGPAPHLIPSEVANELIGNVGLRDRIPFFATRVGDSVTLPGGDATGNDGWFALRSVPSSWDSDPGAADGVENYWLAGPGLGSPDEDGNRITMLSDVPDVVPLRASGLGALPGRTVCAIVYDHDLLVVSGDVPHANLAGSTLGVAAFEVIAVDTSGDSPAVTIRVLNAKDSCGDTIAPFVEAPNPFLP